VCIVAEGGPRNHRIFPMALSSDNSLLIIRITNVPRPTDVVDYIVSGLVVLDVNAGVIVGTVGRTLYGAGRINVRFVGDTNLLLATYTSNKEAASGQCAVCGLVLMLFFVVLGQATL